MAGDVTTMITELLDNSDVIRNMKAEQEALAKVDAKAKALGVTRGQLLKAMKAEDAERDRAIRDQLRQAAAEEKYLAEVRQRSFAMERAAEKSERYYSTQNALIGSTGQLSQGMGSLSQQLADVAVGLQGGQKPMTVLIQQGPQIADLFRTNSALAGAFSGALNVLGASAAGAVVLGTPLIAWSKALDEQNEKTRATTAALSAAIDQMGEGASAIGGLQKELERSALRLSGQEGVVEGMEAAEKAGGAYADMLQGLNRDLQIHQDALRDVENGAEGFFEAAFGPSGIERVKQADALKSTIADLTAKIKAMEKEQAIAADTAELVALGERALVQSNKDVAKSAKDAANAQKEALELAGLEREGRFLRDQATMEEWAAYLKEQAAEEATIQETLQKAYTATGDAREQQFLDDQERMAKWAQSQRELIASQISLASTAISSVNSVVEAVVKDRTEYVQDAQDDYEEALEEGDAATIASAKKRLTAEKQAAMKAWEIQQAAAFATAVAMAAQGIAVAAAAYPPPANAPAIAAAALTGAANVAVVAANPPPEFDDTPGVIQAQGSNRSMASFKRGDYVVAAQDPAKLIQQAMAPLMKGAGRRQEYGGGQQVRTTVFIGANRAAQIDAVARLGRRGPARGQRPLGRRVASTGGSG